jgi:APA family basic amino acid/polyamine antiporter
VPGADLTTWDRRLGPFSATLAVVGGIIGSGIFLNPAIVAQRVGSGAMVLLAWALGGAIALAGAFCFAELGRRAPRAGGGYVYLRDALGPLPGFLYGWALLLVISTGAMAAVAVTFARYALALLGQGPELAVPVAVGAIVLLTIVNWFGVAPGAITQNVFTLLKLAALVLLITIGLLSGAGAGGAGTAIAPSEPAFPGAAAAAMAMGAALVPVLFSYGGWQQTNFIAEELVDAERTLPRALVLGTSIVVAVYMLANLAYLRVLGADGLAASSAPAADLLARTAGPAGRVLISAGIAASTFGFLDLVILVSPRVYQAMAADGAFVPALARLHPRWRTPSLALIVQAVWACALALSGTYGQLLDYVVFGDWIFFGLCAVALIVYRRRSGPPDRFGVPLWPLTPLLFIAAACYVVVSSVLSNPGNALLGAGLLLLGVPVFLLGRKRRGGAASGA